MDPEGAGLSCSGGDRICWKVEGELGWNSRAKGVSACWRVSYLGRGAGCRPVVASSCGRAHPGPACAAQRKVSRPWEGEGIPLRTESPLFPEGCQSQAGIPWNDHRLATRERLRLERVRPLHHLPSLFLGGQGLPLPPLPSSCRAGVSAQGAADTHTLRSRSSRRHGRWVRGRS